MAFTLHDAILPSYLQILGSVAAMIDTAEHFCVEHGVAPEHLIQARLAKDMMPFAFQVKSVAVHSLGAIERVRRGTFSPDRMIPPATFAGLRSRMAATIDALSTIDPTEINSFIGREMVFETETARTVFLAEDFLLSFSQPNFYFHAVTAYDLLRTNGVLSGKATSAVVFGPGRDGRSAS